MGNLPVATRSAITHSATELEFTNPDGSPASWFAPVPRSTRWIHLALRAVPACALGVPIIIGAGLEGAWIGLAIGAAILLASLGWAYKRFVGARLAVREYATRWEPIPDKERYRKAAKWVGAAFVLGAFFFWGLYANDGLSERWGWALGSFIAFAAPGGAVLTQRRRRTLTPDALKAKCYYYASERPPPATNATVGIVEGFIVRTYRATLVRMYRATFVRAFGERGSRYIFAVATFACAWYVAVEATETQHTILYTVLLVVLGLVLAWDAVFALIGAAIVIAFVTAIFKGIAAMPVSVAIIVGALIIANSNARR